MASRARAVAQALADEGVELVFGIPGTHNIELWDALAAGPVRAVVVTDEQSASFMADGAWRASGRLACVNVVPGAGLTHALSGIAEAWLDNVAMLVLGCGIRRDTGRAFQLHDVDQLAVARPVTKGAFLVERGEELYRAVRQACRLARTPPAGPVFVEIPANLYMLAQPATEPWREPAAPPAAPLDPEALERAVELLGASRRPLVYAGLGAAGADVVALAEALEAPVATTFQGKGVVPESHPLALWPGFGPAAPPFAREVAAGCDATLAIGCRFGEVATASYGLEPPRPLVHVDVDPAVFGRNYETDLAVAADASEFVTALLERVARREPDPGLRGQIRDGRAAVRRAALEASGAGVSPARLLEALQRRFGPRTVFTTDSGNGTFLAVELLELEAAGLLLAPVDYSCMGYAVPAAIGARLACPDRPVVALAGDGAWLMTGLELLTAATGGVPVVCVVLRDGELAQIAQFQQVAFDRKVGSVLPEYDLEALCRGVGVSCLTLTADAGIEAVLEQAAAEVAAGRPVAVDARVDYSRKTWFTRGVVRTTFGRLPWRDRLRFLARALGRRAGSLVTPRRNG